MRRAAPASRRDGRLRSVIYRAAMAPDSMERLADLLAVLLHTWEPLTFEQIRERLDDSSVGAYPEGETGRRQFERDKEELRAHGVVITLDYEGRGGAAAYRIRPEDYYLPQVDLTPDEQVALNLASAAVRLGDTGWAETAGWKLGGAGPTPVPRLSVDALEALPDLAAAVSDQRAVAFEHGGKPRTVDAWQLLSREGFWYLCGHDHGSGEHRFFRVDRIEPGSVRIAGPWSSPPPDDYDAGARLPPPWRMGEQAVTALVAVDRAAAGRVRSDLGDPEPVGTTDDGWTLLPVEVAHPPSFRSWLLGHLDHVRVEAPDELRDQVVRWLEEMAEAR